MQKMRISTEIADFFKAQILGFAPEAKIYLFGSRTDDTKRGGDIDIMILSHEKMILATKRKIRIAFYKQFGEQKIDIVNFRFDEQSNFKDLVLPDAIEL